MPTVRNQPERDVVDTVVEHLDPQAFGPVIDTANDHVDDPGVGNVRVACDLHRLVRQEVDHRDYANFRHPPREALRHGANCVDATALYCSLLIQADFRCRITLVTQGVRGHMFPEVHIDAENDAIRHDIKTYYDGYRRYIANRYAAISADEQPGHWVIADPATSDCLGDPTGLIHLGYMSEGEAGCLKFAGNIERYEIRDNLDDV
jgi:hypothetical protein